MTSNSNNSRNGNKLIGWLVSYADDEKGAFHEIRIGRTFVSSRPLPDLKQLTLNNNSISTPHLVINANNKHKIMVQDIFSDQGSFLTRSNQQNENRISGPVEVSHGDWIRMGDKTRYQVCLIDVGSR